MKIAFPWYVTSCEFVGRYVLPASSGWNAYVLPKRWNTSTTLHGVITSKKYTI